MVQLTNQFYVLTCGIAFVEENIEIFKHLSKIVGLDNKIIFN
jgi:hypothetical protein